MVFRIGAVKTPSKPPLVTPTAPNVKMDLCWVHGYTSGSTAANTRVGMETAPCISFCSVLFCSPPLCARMGFFFVS